MIMKTVFMDTNVINRLCDSGFTATEIKEHLKDKDLVLCTGGNLVTFELAATFLEKKNFNRAKKLFCFLKSLDLSFAPHKDYLFEQEVNKLCNCSSVNHLSPQSYEKDVKSKIDEYCEIAKPEDFKQDDVNFIEEKKKNLIEMLKNWDPKRPGFIKVDVPKSMKFNEFVDKYFFNKLRFSDQLFVLFSLHFIFNCKLTPFSRNEIEKFREHMHSYPVLRTLMYSHLYLNYFAQIHNKRPSKSMICDHIQLIEASYYTYFVSDDKKLLQYAKYINPNINLININEIIPEFKCSRLKK